MAIPLYQVDAFSDRRFSGNPAAVCLLHEPAEEAWMQGLAAEMNLSETAYLVPRDSGFDLRWFTPAIEVALCGHATLASAHILWETGRLAGAETARFHTKSGVLTARAAGNRWIEMDFPASVCEPAPAPAGLLEALEVEPVAVCRAGADYLVEVRDEVEVQAASPDLVALAEVQARGIILTAEASLPGYDVVSRFFAPAAGIPEDPVTGSSHCALGPYWGAKLGKSELLAYQASARGGTVRVTVAGDRVLLGGQAVTVLRGELA